MNKRTKFLLGIGVIAALVIAFQVAAFAVHDTGVFELDGNATNDPNVDGDDWDNSTAKTFVAEPNLNATIFTGGGSKDPQDISKWAWKDGAGGLPDKDNLLDAYAARYTDDNGDELLYFGADRYDNSGDAHMGFWFLQDEVALGTNSIGGGTGLPACTQRATSWSSPTSATAAPPRPSPCTSGTRHARRPAFR